MSVLRISKDNASNGYTLGASCNLETTHRAPLVRGDKLVPLVRGDTRGAFCVSAETRVVFPRDTTFIVLRTVTYSYYELAMGTESKKVKDTNYLYSD